MGPMRRVLASTSMQDIKQRREDGSLSVPEVKYYCSYTTTITITTTTTSTATTTTYYYYSRVHHG